MTEATICVVDAHGYLVGGPVTVEDTDPCPQGSIFVLSLPPAPGEGEYVRLAPDGSWELTTEPPPAYVVQVPAKVHKYWLTKVLEALGVMDDVEDALDAMAAAGNRTPRRDWQAATEIERANQLVNEFAIARAWSTEQVDAMFVQAAAYQAASGA